jgi:hypothetical protein
MKRSTEVIGLFPRMILENLQVRDGISERTAEAGFDAFRCKCMQLFTFRLG